MKLNLKKLAEVEKRYSDNSISLSALQTMIDQVFYPQKDPSGWNNTSSTDYAINTLKDLGILEDTADKTSKPLNS